MTNFPSLPLISLDQIKDLYVPSGKPYSYIPFVDRRKMEAFGYDYQYLKGKGEIYRFNKQLNINCDTIYE